MEFGISTHLFHNERLAHAHLAAIADHGFEAVEVFATRSHFDYHDAATIARLGSWLQSTGLTLHSLHAPITTSFADGKWEATFSTASRDPHRWEQAMRETRAALEVARHLPYRTLVMHLGVPDGHGEAAIDNDRDAARRTLDALQPVAAPLGVRLAIELIPNPLSGAESLVGLLTDRAAPADLGACLDFGHAHLMGDVVDALESLSGWLITTHLHDNRGRDDSHLLPFEGTIDWPRALATTVKVGFDGPIMLEVADQGAPLAVLERARAARTRLDGLLAM